MSKDKIIPASVGSMNSNWDEEFASFVQFINSYCQNIVSQNLLGRLLTLIDASVPPSSQTEALKSLIKQECYAAYDDIWRANCKLDRDYKITPLGVKDK